MGLLNSIFGIGSSHQVPYDWDQNDHSIDSQRYAQAISNQRVLQEQFNYYQQQAALQAAQMQAAYNFSRSNYPNTQLGDKLKNETRQVEAVKACTTEEEIAWALLEGYVVLTGIYYAKFKTEEQNV